MPQITPEFVLGVDIQCIVFPRDDENAQRHVYFIVAAPKYNKL